VRNSTFTVREQIDQRSSGRPPRIGEPDRCRIAVEQCHDDFGNDPAADRSEPISRPGHGRFSKDVVPKRRLVLPPDRGKSDLVRRERLHPHMARDRFSRRQSNAVAPLKIAYGERVVVLDIALACNGDRQLNERSRQQTVDPLRALGGRCPGGIRTAASNPQRGPAALL